MKLDIGSLTTDVIRIKELTLIKPEVTYEYASAGSNLDILRRNIERSIAQQRGNTGNPQDSKLGKKIVIDYLYIKNGTAIVSAEAFNGDVLSVPFPDLRLQGIGKKSNGATAGEAAGQVLNTITQQVTQSVASLSVGIASKTLQKGVETATKTIKDLFK
jgi:hypothetical protein